MYASSGMPSMLKLLRPGVSRGVLGLLVHDAPCSFEIGVLHSCEIRNKKNMGRQKQENTYRFEPVVHMVADGVVATHLRLDHTEHALGAVLSDRAVEELLFIRSGSVTSTV
jgi:threonine dehydrogenase-like Zn-dependent dehydrogenase